MGLFNKNSNEAAYVGGKKHWADVIKNSGPGELLIWRQPEEDFNTNSTLIVMPGEEAIFIKGGTVERLNKFLKTAIISYQLKTIHSSVVYEMLSQEVSALSTVLYILSAKQIAKKFVGEPKPLFK